MKVTEFQKLENMIMDQEKIEVENPFVDEHRGGGNVNTENSQIGLHKNSASSLKQFMSPPLENHNNIKIVEEGDVISASVSSPFT